MITRIYIIVFVAALVLAYLLLYWANAKRYQRYKQISFPILAVVLGLVALWLYLDFYEIIKTFILDEVRSEIGEHPVFLYADILFDLLYALLFIPAFIILKYTTRFILLRFKKKYNPAYYFCQYECMPTLKHDWHFVRLFFKFHIWFSLFLFLASFWALYKGIPFIPLFGIVALIISLECFWYLNGIRKSSVQEDVLIGNDAKSAFNTKLKELWEKYQDVWESKLILSWHHSRNAIKSTPISNVNDPIISMLMKRGFQFSTKEKGIYENIRDGKDILIEAPYYCLFAPAFFAGIYNKLFEGKNILFIVKKRINSQEDIEYKAVEKWINDNIVAITGLQHFANPQAFLTGKVAELTSNIVIASASDILESNAYKNSWFDDLQTIVLVNLANLFDGEISTTTILLSILKNRNSMQQVITFSDAYREGIEASNRSIVPVNNRLSEVRYFYKNPLKNYVLVWNSDSEKGFQTEILKGYIKKYLGDETTLSILAWYSQIVNIKLFGIEHLPYEEYCEEIDNNKEIFNTSPDTLEGSASTAIEYNDYPYLSDIYDEAALFCRDSKHNLPVALRNWNSFASKSSLINVVCPPYLLREYFADNIKYFYETPIYGLSPNTNETNFTAANFLLQQMMASELSENQIAEIVKRYCRNITIVDILKTIEDLFKPVLGIANVLSHVNISRQYVFDENELNFKPVFYYSLSKSVLDSHNLQFKNVVTIKEGENILMKLQYDLLFQQYLEGQQHAFNKSCYRIDDFDALNSILNVSFVTPAKINRYVQSRDVEIIQYDVPTFNTQRQDRFLISFYEGKFRVKTNGYYTFKGKVELNDFIDFTELHTIPEREYIHGRFIKIDFFKQETLALDYNTLNTTLCIILSELMSTLFPETHQYLLCGSPLINQNYENTMFKNYFTTVYKQNENVNIDENSFSVYIFEDAHQDLGLLTSIYNQFDYIMYLVDDYLLWMIDEPSQKIEDTPLTIETASEPSEKPQDEMISEHSTVEFRNEIFRNKIKDKTMFLKFGFDDFPFFYDLSGLKNYLGKIYPNNPLTSERIDFINGKKRDFKMNDSGHICDFCAGPIEGLAIETLEDGRERCPECRKEAINTVQKLQDILNESRSMIRTLFKVEIPEGITIEFADASVIQRRIGEEFVPTSGFDSRAVGLAWEKTIMIENGAPYARTLSTVVHELTHIWQNANLDTMLMREKADLLFIEGHAVWASVKVLEHKNIAEEYRKHYDNRDDEYGNGFKTIKELLKKQSIDNAFVMLKQMFPK